MGIFAFIEDKGRDVEIGFMGPPRTSLLPEFFMEMLIFGHYSIMEGLAENGF